MYIEPCCAERQLGQLFRENKGHAVLMQTSGDMLLKHWMQAIMLLVGDRPRTLTLAVPVFTDKMMDIVAKYLRLEWVANFKLLTTDQIPAEILQQFADKVGCSAKALMERIEVAADSAIPNELIAFSGPEGTVVVQGSIIDTVTPGMTLHAGVMGKTEGNGVRSVMDAWGAHFRLRKYEVTFAIVEPAVEAAGTGAASGTESAPTKQQSKKPRKQQKTKKV